MAQEIKKENKKKVAASSSRANNAYKTLIEPWITEASTAAMELNKYVFKVYPGVNKYDVKSAIENLYKVKVVSVNTISMPRKFRNYGKTPGWKAGFKKAIVTVKEGDKIELFEGV